MMLSTSLEDLERQMRSCEQAPGMNMLEHGELVHKHYLGLLQRLSAGDCDEPVIRAVYQQRTLLSIDRLKRYHLYHDCGKHLTLQVDESGRRHFPNHAATSAEQYRKVFPLDDLTAELIEQDMAFHVARGDALLETCRHPYAPELYLTAWAEIGANAEMFGGTKSQSYKIKAKRLQQAGKKLLNNLEG